MEMKKRIVMASLVVSLFLPAFYATSAESEKEIEPPFGRLVETCETENGIGMLIEVYDIRGLLPRTLVIVQGPPFEMGYQFGILTGRDFEELLFDYISEVFKGLPYELVKPLLLLSAKTMEPFIPKEYIEEMKGLALGFKEIGSGLTYDDVLIVHTHVDTVSGLSSIIACDSVAAWGNATVDGKLIHGHNCDWAAGSVLSKGGISLLKIPDNGYPYMISTWKGVIGGFNGMNAKGISIGQMSEFSKDGIPFFGDPIMWLYPEVLQYSSSIDDAIDIVSSRERTYGSNLLVTDGKSAVVLETSEDLIAVKVPGYVGVSPNPRPETYLDVIWSSNIYQTWKLAVTQPIIRTLILVTGLLGLDFDMGNIRYERMGELLEENYGRIDAEIVGMMMRDQEKAPSTMSLEPWQGW
jgi:hypothetical protein